MRRSSRIFLCLFLFTQAKAGLAQEPARSDTGSSLNYPNTAEGLQSLIKDVLQAAKANDRSREAELIHGFLFPEGGQWFIDEFGPAFGARMSRMYRKLMPDLEHNMEVIYEGNVQRGWMEPKVQRYADAAEADSPVDNYLNCMDEVVPLYGTAGNGEHTGYYYSQDSKDSNKIIAGDPPGYFVFIQNGFRFIPAEVLTKLPKERPVRIHLEMNLMNSKLIKNVRLRFPERAVKERRSGTVIVRLTLDLRGSIKEARLLQGDPVLSESVLEAVKQWQFEPTTLDGDPVEVEVDVQMTFDLMK
jgi:TonB family protein